MNNSDYGDNVDNSDNGVNVYNSDNSDNSNNGDNGDKGDNSDSSDNSDSRENMDSNYKHYLVLGSDASSVWIFCARFLDFIWRYNKAVRSLQIRGPVFRVVIEQSSDVVTSFLPQKCLLRGRQW